MIEKKKSMVLIAKSRGAHRHTQQKKKVFDIRMINNLTINIHRAGR